MSAFELAIVAMIVMFAASGVLLLGIVLLKRANRRRRTSHEKRRRDYLKLLSLHIAAPGVYEELTLEQAGDDAFIDAIIDLRATLSGEAVEELQGVIDRTDLINHQAKRLRSLFPLGRRLRAVVSLAEIGDARAARILLYHLGDRVPEIRVQSARGLARMRYTPAIDVILDRFEGETPWVQTRYAESLALFGRDAVWPLTAFIRVHHRHGNTRGVTEFIRVLGIIGDSEVGPALAELLYTAESVEVRIAIIESLGLVGGPLALRPLRRMSQSDDWRIRAKTATAFGEIGDPSVNPVLTQYLGDSSWWVRRNSAGALRVLPGGLRFLHAALDSPDEYTRDAAAEALADAGELMAAQERIDSGFAEPLDIRLVSYMHSTSRTYS